MQKKTWLQKLLTPKQIMVMHTGTGSPTKNYHLRPLTIIAIPMICLLIGSAISYRYVSLQPSKNDTRPILLQSQKKLADAHTTIAASAAENELKQAQINSLQSIIREQQNEIYHFKQQINVFNSILRARKGHFTEVIEASLKQITPFEMAFHVTLVKGGNYPRQLKGSIQFTATNAKGELVPILFEGNTSKLPYKMETHIFLQGKIHLANPTPLPDDTTIELIIYNRSGKEIMRKKCQFEELL